MIQIVFEDYSLFNFFLFLTEDPILGLMFSQLDTGFALPGRILHKGCHILMVSHLEARIPICLSLIMLVLIT